MTSSLEEKKNQIKKINKYYIVVLILCLVILVAGLTTAYYTMVASQEKDSTRIHTGTLIANFTDGIEIRNPLLIPRYEPARLSDTADAYTNKFNVQSTGTLDQTVDVFLNVTTNELKEGSLKYKVFNANGDTMKTGNITKSGDTKILENVYIKSKDTAEFTLVIWLQETGTPQNSEQDKSFIGTLRVEAIQMKQ